MLTEVRRAEPDPAPVPAPNAGRGRHRAEGRYLRDVVYGAIDGTVTTFAVVTGVAGAGLSTSIVLVLGAASLLGDGFTMAVGNYLGTRAAQQWRHSALLARWREIAGDPTGARERVRHIYASKGFDGAGLDSVVDVITADEERWIKALAGEESGPLPRGTSPWRAAAATFSAFVLVGALPLLPFLVRTILRGAMPSPFLWSTILTGLTFFAVGALKGRFVGHRWVASGLETLGVGGVAALLAFLVGSALRGIAGVAP
jgi:VIT1/CCC1 family predicted Fe2+/Mn2+ transporter